MLTRTAIYEGTIQAGKEDEFFAPRPRRVGAAVGGAFPMSRPSASSAGSTPTRRPDPFR